MSDFTPETDASSTDSLSDAAVAAAAPPADTVVVFGFVPVSLDSVVVVVVVVTDSTVDEVGEVVDGTELEEAVAAVVLSVEDEEAAGTVDPAPVAAAAADGGEARFSLVTTLEYCCISITAASNNT